MTPNVAELIRDHVSLSNTCIDRLYINGYVPTLQTSGQLCYFLRDYLGNPIPSPALFRPLHDRFVRSIEQVVKREDIPFVHFKRGQRKDDIANEYHADFKKPEGVVLVGVAQEKMSSFKARKVAGKGGGVSFDFSRQPVAVNHFYFYVHDREWGPAFIKVGTYLPYPVKLCLNGHEWAKQQLRQHNIAFESLDNGFLSCESPERLQEICDALSGQDVQRFFDRWSRILPWPLSPEDRAAGFNHRLSIWQSEVSCTQVFERPVQGRFEYKRSHVKQYFKEERALRTETTINDPGDFNVNKGLKNLEHLRNRGEQVNRKLLEVERVSHNCALSQDALDRLQKPTVVDGQRASALRFGDTRVLALLHALCLFFHLTIGFRNRDLREKVASLLGVSTADYTQGKMTYDLRRLRLKGMIARIPGTNRYTVTTFGLRAALFYTKVQLRLLRPGIAMMTESSDNIPPPLRRALRQIDNEISRMCEQTCLRPTG